MKLFLKVFFVCLMSLIIFTGCRSSYRYEKESGGMLLQIPVK